VEKHCKTYRNEPCSTDSAWDPTGDQHPGSLHRNAGKSQAVPSAEGMPQGTGQSSGTKQHHFRGSTLQQGWCGAGSCAKHHGQPSSRFHLTPVLTEPQSSLSCPRESSTCPQWLLMSQPAAGGPSERFQQITGATARTESSAAARHCPLVPFLWGHMIHSERFGGQHVLWTSASKIERST